MLKAILTQAYNVCVCVSLSLHTGAASKRFGIDGDREAVPLMLEVVYNRVSQELLLLTCHFGSRKKTLHLHTFRRQCEIFTSVMITSAPTGNDTS